MRPVLYSYWRSSCSYRVRIALAHKGIEYDYAAVHLTRGGGEQHEDGYRSKNPMSQVPTLEWQEEGGVVRRLSQSIAILEYLEERWPERPLLPADPYLRGQARRLSEMVNSGIQPLQNLWLLNRLTDLGVETRGFAREVMARGLSALETAVTELAGAHMVGDEPTFADCCLVPQLYNARRNELDLTGFPTLVRIEQACLALPAFSAAHPDRQPDAPSPEEGAKR
jgi:maleylpyruvate isomerase